MRTATLLDRRARVRAATRAALAAALLPVVAFAQDSRIDASGTLLLEALPPNADLVIHTPSLPRLLRSAPESGLGTAEAWAGAFRAQLRRWGAGAADPQRLVQAGERLLAAADGEVLLASMPVAPWGVPPRDRGVVFAFRSTLGPADLTKVVDDLAEAGLRLRWPAAPRKETLALQPVTVLSSETETLYLAITGNEPGAADTRVDAPIETGLRGSLVVATDHPQTLATLLRGLDRAAAGGAPPDVTRQDATRQDVARRLEVRWGAGAAAWTGWTYFQREAASWRSREAAPVVSPPEAHAPLVAVAVTDVRDVPLFPRPLPSQIAAHAKDLSQSPLLVTLGEDGVFAIAGHPAAGGETSATPAPPTKAARTVAGLAASGGWLRALRTGAIAAPFGGFDAEALDPVIASLAVTQTAAVHDWKASAEAGEIRGPAWHGPATLMAVRVLDDIRSGVAPGAVPPPPAPPPPRPTDALAPPKPRDPAPPPPHTEDAPTPPAEPKPR